jgi:hypothetical protein
MRVFIGLDVSLAKTAIRVVDHDGAVQWQVRLQASPARSSSGWRSGPA